MKKNPAKSIREKTAETSALLREKETLDQQVKRLIRAESKLYLYQEELDAQLREYKDLYELNKKLVATASICDIFDHAVRYVIQNLDFERCIIFHRLENAASFHVCALDGYYDNSEKSLVGSLVMGKNSAFLSSLTAGAEKMICTADSDDEELNRYRPKLLMDEYYLYPLGARLHSQALLALGNTAQNAGFYRRVSDSNGTLLSIGNFVGAVSSALENSFFYNKLKQTLEHEKQAQKALRESEQKYRQLSEVLEERVKEAVDELRQKDRIMIIQGRQAVMGEMISNIAHQWRQPLNILGLLAQDLQIANEMGKMTDELVETNARKTMDTIQYMSKTIDDFRYFFNPDTLKVKFSVTETVDKALSLLKGSFTTRNIRTEVTGADDLVITGHPAEFSQAILNILINAREALITRKVEEPFIGIKVSAKGNKCVVTISDNAGGIPEEIIDRIFEPYFTTKGPEQGTGIGLFMCKTIIEKNMHGTLTARNVGAGAEFRIEV